MKSAHNLEPSDPDQKLLRDYDLREIDAADPRSRFHRKYVARLRRIVQAVTAALPPGAIVLDVGCSQANASLLLAEQGYCPVGVDIRRGALQYALSKHERGWFRCVVGSAARLPFRAGQVDAVILGEMLEHCADPVRVLDECLRPLKPGGLLVVTTPNARYLGGHDTPYTPAQPASVELAQRQFLPDTHVFVFTRAQLRRLLRRGGLEVLTCGYEGSLVYSDRLSLFKRFLAPAQLDSLSRLLNHLPVLNALLSYTLVAVARKGA